MPVEGEDEPSPQQWVRDPVQRFEATGVREANGVRDTGVPVGGCTSRGRRSGQLATRALQRRQHEGRSSTVASDGGGPPQPVWYRNLTADPTPLLVPVLLAGRRSQPIEESSS